MTINHKAGSSALLGGRASNQSTQISWSTSGTVISWINHSS